MNISYNEFHVSRAIRDACHFPLPLFSSTGNVILGNLKNVRTFAAKLNMVFVNKGQSDKQVSAGSLNATGLLDEIFHFACMMYRKTKAPSAMTELLADLEQSFGKSEMDKLLLEFTNEFPPVAVYNNEISAEKYLSLTALDTGTGKIRSNREATFEEMILLHLANEDPAFKPFAIMFDDANLSKNPVYAKSWEQTKAFFKKLPYWGTYSHDLITFLKEPVAFAPDSLRDQLDYVRTHWFELLGEWLKRLLSGIDVLNEEEKPKWGPMNGGSPNMEAPNYENLMKEYERFSPDRDWMPKVVLMAKTVLVWLYQLSKKYNRNITRLDQIPDEELDTLRDEGFTGLWLIGLWQRSDASKRIKQLCGNPEAAASAYSLNDYEIADNIGGWDALANLRTRLWKRGIRLASDMVPNHTGMDSKWIADKPDLFVQRRDNPFPQYTFNGENLSHNSRVAIYLEDHYYSKNDCAVVFKRVDTSTGDTRYIYHGNDGTGMPWNDTAQIDFLNPAAREEVIQEILHVARNFPIIRFDAAMVLAKKHIKRLWYPEPGKGGDIATRSEYALPSEEFEKRIPNEFWREVVDRVAQEVPDTLLLAEAFWMMEGYFTRTLGMHRVYNSAFMNMLKKEENAKYRDTVKNTIQFDPQVLKRFVNFMNNPDEETAVAQFGKGDKYFGVCTLMVTMPGLPMFGHGQIEGFEEKYGMEYTRAYKDESPDKNILDRHCHDIFPLIKKRYLFAEIQDFLFYDVYHNSKVNENIFAYSNRAGNESAVVFYNNKYEQADGWIKVSCEYAVKTGSGENDRELKTRTIADGLGLSALAENYCIFREQRSNLWFIRSCTDIFEHGLYVSLNGFESQILLDVRQQADDKTGKLRTLCEFLNGRGTPDLEIAWQEYHYRTLYDALKKIITPQFFEQMHTLSLTAAQRKALKLKVPTVQSVTAPMKKNLLAFYKIACMFAATESKAKRQTNSAPKKTATAAKPALASPEKQLASFKKELALIIRAVPKAQKSITAAKPKAAPASLFALCSAAKTPAEFFFRGACAHEEGACLFAAYSILTTIAQSGYARTWSLDRKLSEFIASCGISVKTIRSVYQRAFILAPAVAAKPIVIKTPAQQKAAAYAIVSELILGQDSAILTGANDFNGIRWFNKELAETSLYYAVAIPMLASSPAHMPALLALYKKLNNAKESAEYKCAIFAAKFAPAKKARKTGATEKKTATKKIPEKKAMNTKKASAKKPTISKKKTAVKKTAVKKTVTKKASAAKQRRERK